MGSYLIKLNIGLLRVRFGITLIIYVKVESGSLVERAAVNRFLVRIFASQMANGENNNSDDTCSNAPPM